MDCLDELKAMGRGTAQKLLVDLVGEMGNTDIALVILSSDKHVEPYWSGPGGVGKTELLGMLEMAKHAILNYEVGDDDAAE